jgi:hypothetical protein
VAGSGYHSVQSDSRAGNAAAVRCGRQPARARLPDTAIPPFGHSSRSRMRWACRFRPGGPASRPAHGGGRQRRQPVSAGCSCVSVFLGGLRRPVAGVAGAALPSCCVCWWAVGSHKPRRRSGPAPAQRDGAGTGGAETGPATFPDPGGRRREAQRSGFSPWKRSFCSSRSDRDGTVFCRGQRHRA